MITIVFAAFAIGFFNIENSAMFAFEKDVPKIGYVIDLSGPGAYWGESTVAGAELAKKDLAKEGIGVELIFEDYKMNPKEAVTAVQKLINFDNVDFIYSEFTPAAMAVSSTIQNQDLLQLYISAPISPLKEEYNIKSFTDYKKNCRLLALKFKEKGILKMGGLMPKDEFGQLCLEGVLEIYPDIIIEEYFGLGKEKDLRTQVTKLKNANVEAIINPGIDPDSRNMLKIVKELGWKINYGGSTEGLSETIIDEYADVIENYIYFRFVDVSKEFKERVDIQIGHTPDTYEAAAFAYMHTKQIARAIDYCGKDSACIKQKILNSPKEEFFGFDGFNGRIADFEILIIESEWINKNVY